MPKKRIYSYEGKLREFSSKKIYLNVNYLQEGKYELNIIHKEKLIKKITFKKK